MRYEDPGTQIVQSDSRGVFLRLPGAFDSRAPNFSLGSNNARGAAAAMACSTRRGRLELDGVSYTTCPPDSNDWVTSSANDIDLDTRAGVGTAKGIKLRFQGVPILYAPYIVVSDRRCAQVRRMLTPEIGSSAAAAATRFAYHYYWNIAPNYDATITPRLLTERGLQVQHAVSLPD